MSKPPPGNYFIINGAASPAGRSLALNYNGADVTVTVAELGTSLTQMWIIRNYVDGRTQSISPQTAPNLEICMGNGVLRTLPAHAYVWTIREREGICTIQDGGVTVFWGLQQANNSQPVYFGTGTGNEKQNWLLVPA